MDPVVHFEMPYDDRERMAGFYESAFGWRMEMLGADMRNYVLAATTETGECGPTSPGAINGGFFAREQDWPVQHPSFVVAVEEIGAAMAKVRDAGGAVLGEPHEVPGVGRHVYFRDTEGNLNSMLQPVPRSWHARESE